jgi:signal transduction histidine kinase
MIGQKTNIQLINKNNNSINPIFVEVDRDRIIQVLSNLLSNAIKFTNQGDTGSGINSEIFGRLFSKFASKSYQGTGLV